MQLGQCMWSAWYAVKVAAVVWVQHTWMLLFSNAIELTCSVCCGAARLHCYLLSGCQQG